MSPLDFLTSKCPVCQAQTHTVQHTRTTINRKAGAVGGPNADVSVEAVTHHEFFVCGLERHRLFKGGRWSPWSLQDDQGCGNAQEVALQLRQQLNDARSTDG